MNTEAQSEDKIEFGKSAETPDALTIVEGFTISTRRAYTDVSAPEQEIAPKPDTGYKGNTITLTCLFNRTATGYPGSIATLKKWANEPNTTNILRNGIFGFRSDFITNYNLAPISTVGYKLQQFDIQWDANRFPTPRGIIILEQSGGKSV